MLLKSFRTAWRSKKVEDGILINLIFIYISVAIASFANFVPEIVELLGNRPKYAGSYEVRFVKEKTIY